MKINYYFLFTTNDENKKTSIEAYLITSKFEKIESIINCWRKPFQKSEKVIRKFATLKMEYLFGKNSSVICGYPNHKGEIVIFTI